MHKWVALIRMRSEKWKIPVFLCRFILAVYLCICTCVCLPMSESVTRGQQCLLEAGLLLCHLLGRLYKGQPP